MIGRHPRSRNPALQGLREEGMVDCDEGETLVGVAQAQKTGGAGFTCGTDCWGCCRRGERHPRDRVSRAGESSHCAAIVALASEDIKRHLETDIRQKEISVGKPFTRSGHVSLLDFLQIHRLPVWLTRVRDAGDIQFQRWSLNLWSVVLEDQRKGKGQMCVLCT